METRLQTIPEGSVEIQTGLWAYLNSFTYNGVVRTNYRLYSAEGYCFYVPANNLDEDGNLLPESERMYYQYMSTPYTTVDDVNANIVSVPVQEGYEIASSGTSTETI